MIKPFYLLLIKSQVKHFLYSFLFVLVAITIVGCGTGQIITLYADGSANVKTSIDDSLQIKTFYKTDLIYNLKYEKYKGTWIINFDIQTIDSLGNYLSPVFNKGFFQFKYNHDTLAIYNGYMEPFIEDNWYCCNTRLDIHTEKQIKLTLDHNTPIKSKKNNFIIKKSRRAIQNTKKKTELKIVFQN